MYSKYFCVMSVGYSKGPCAHYPISLKPHYQLGEHMALRMGQPCFGSSSDEM